MNKTFILFITLCISLLVITIVISKHHERLYNLRQKYILQNPTKPLKYIPKKIFQTISDKSKIAPVFQKNIDKLKSQNPDWEYSLFDDSDIEKYVKDHYGGEYFDCYNMINPKYGAARADFFRYLLMYREGGVYLDIKSGAEFPLKHIIQPDDEYILSYWTFPNQFHILNNNTGEYQQWHIICRPGHPFLSAVIKSVMENIKTYRISDGVGKLGVLKVTGPIVYTESIMPIVDKCIYRLIDDNIAIGLVYNNINANHKNKYSKPYYGEIDESIILSLNK